MRRMIILKVTKIKGFILFLEDTDIQVPQLYWECTKYEKRKNPIRVLKANAKKNTCLNCSFRKQIKRVRQNPDCIFDCNYLDYKKANGVRSKVTLSGTSL